MQSWSLVNLLWLDRNKKMQAKHMLASELSRHLRAIPFQHMTLPLAHAHAVGVHADASFSIS